MVATNRASQDGEEQARLGKQQQRRSDDTIRRASRDSDSDVDDDDEDLAKLTTSTQDLNDDEEGQDTFDDRRQCENGVNASADEDKTISTTPSLRRTRASRRSQPSALHRIYSISKEALPTLLLSLVSLIFSGEVLVHLSRWPVFLKVDKLFILIPILLNLKGNLEMNLSLRMSTSANIGELDIRRTRRTLVGGNMTLLQVQALIVSAGAGVVAFLLGVAADRKGTNITSITPATASGTASATSALAAAAATPTAGPVLQPRRIIHHHPKPPSDPTMRLRNGYFEFVLVLATGMLSASLSSAILGNFMCALVVIARRCGANPDNIASPLAASLGDLLTLTLVGLVASSLVRFEGTGLATVIFVCLVGACLVCWLVTRRNSYVKELLSSGWVPLILAMFISSGAGLVLDSFVQEYEGFALLVPVITGLPGACAAILVSRTTTCLHAGKGEVALREPNGGRQGSGGFFSLDARSSTSQSGFWGRVYTTLITPWLSPPTEGYLIPFTLLAIGLMIEVLFLVLTFTTGQLTFGWSFALTFSLSSLGALAFSLALAHVMTMELWKRDYDPDIYCLPFVSSIVDVVGQALLVMAYATAKGLAGDVVKARV